MPFIYFTVKKINGRKNVNYLLNFTWLFFLVLTIALSTFNFANGGRYRIVIEPFYFLLVIFGFHLSKVKIKTILVYYTSYFFLFFIFNFFYYLVHL